MADESLHVTHVRPVSLPELLAEAEAVVRVDRKYLVPLDLAQRLVDALEQTHHVLEIRGRRSTTYRSTYFDTPELAACRAHLQGRRRRWKVRSRLYVEDGLCRIEIKTRDGRGTTVKSMLESCPSRYGSCEGPEKEFVARSLRGHDLPVDPDELGATMQVGYDRVTLADLAAGTRVTIDRGVRCELDGRDARLDDGWSIVETKGHQQAGVADRVLRELGVRPRSFSKYAHTASLLLPDLHDNAVRRLRDRVIHVGGLSPSGVDGLAS